jgi:hypothetical protein
LTYVFWPQDTVFDWKPKEQQGEQGEEAAAAAAAAAPEGYGTEGEETEDDEDDESGRAPAQRKRPKKKAAASR